MNKGLAGCENCSLQPADSGLTDTLIFFLVPCAMRHAPRIAHPPSPKGYGGTSSAEGREYRGYISFVGSIGQISLIGFIGFIGLIGLIGLIS